MRARRGGAASGRESGARHPLGTAARSAGAAAWAAVLLAGLVPAARPAFADPACNPVAAWEDVYDYPGGAAAAAGVAVTPDGGVVVVGTQYAASLDGDWLIRKYDSLGNVLWSRTAGSDAGGATWDEAVGVAVTAAGNIVVAGHFDTDPGAASYRRIWRVAMHGAGGSLAWSRTTGGGPVTGDQPHAVAVDGTGSIWAVGFLGDDWHMWKLSPGGTTLLSLVTGTPHATDVEAAKAVAVDSANRAVVGGDIDGYVVPGPHPVWQAIVLDAGGVVSANWTYGAAGQANLNGIAVDSSGNVYGAGRDVGQASLVKFGAAGSVLWSRSFTAYAAGGQAYSCVGLDGAGNVIVGGNVDQGAGYGLDWVLRQYNPEGTLCWGITWNHSGGADAAADFAVDATGAVVAAGYAMSGSDRHWVVRKLGRPPCACLSPRPPAYEGPVRVFPNPFDRETARGGTVKFDGVPAGASVRVYTGAGMRVWEEAPPHSSSVVEWNGESDQGRPVAPGAYIWIVDGEGGRQRGTFVVQ